MECVCPILNRITRVDTLDASHEPWRLVRCRETGFVFLANPPEYSQLVDDFAWEKTYAAEKERRRRIEPWAARVSQLLKATKRLLFPRRNRFFTIGRSVLPRENTLHLLDIGCGGGSLLTDLYGRYARLGVKVVPYGVEISRSLAATSGDAFAALGGKVVFAGAMEAIAEFAPDHFDGVFMSSFLEHERQPLSLLQKLPGIIKTTASIILKVPNYDCLNRVFRGQQWCGFRFPDHVNYFTPRTLAILAAEAGLKVARQRFSDRLPLSDSMYAVLRRRLASAA
jgi:SAM-dependent methyltransferase